jgi:trans-feruloyl-CoA hydratase/vanillin synthase
VTQPPFPDDERQLQYEVIDGVAWIVFNRPDKLNSFSPKLYKQVKDTLRLADANKDVDVLVLTGRGRAFSTGGDLTEVLDRITDDNPLPWFEMVDSSWFDVLKNTRKPTIAAVNGIAVAAGFACAMLCDVSIAAERATFGLPEARAGFADSHGIHLMWGRASLTRIKYLVLTGKQISATEAERWGLVTQVVPDDELYDRVNEVIKELRSTSVEARYLLKEYANRMIPALEWTDLYRGLETTEAAAYLQKFKDRNKS